MRTGVKVSFFGLGSHVRIHSVSGCCFCGINFINHSFKNRKEIRGCNSKHRRLRTLYMKEFPYSGDYLSLSASEKNM